MHRKTKLDPTTFACAAVCGLLLGAGCEDKSKPSQAEGETNAAVAAASGEQTDKAKECCMGKNECKGQGGCAVPESNDCAGKNECKGKGGCNMHCPKK